MAFLSSFINDPQKIRVYGLLLILSLALLALSYFLKHREFNEFFVHFSRDLGIAGVVGFFLAITIEELSHAEFRKVAERERAEIKKDVFYYVYGHEIPLSIRTEIDEHILKVPYVRRGVKMQYGLKPIQDPKTNEWYVLQKFAIIYDLENLTTEDFEFPFLAAVDKSPSEGLADRARFIELSVTGCEKPFRWDADTLKTKQKDEGNELSLSLPNEIILLPKPSSADHRTSMQTNLTHVTLQNETVRFLRGHIDFIATSHVCDLELMVLADRRLKVNAKSFEQNPLESVPVTEFPSWIFFFDKTLEDKGDFYYWRLKKPLLAYQGLQIFWVPEGKEFDKTPANAGSKTQSTNSPINSVSGADTAAT
jgi:hypothetical protein